MTMTKSLHTVTAVANVARHLMNATAINGNAPQDGSPAYWACQALAILGYYDQDIHDPTIAACIKSVSKIMGAV